MDKIDAANAVTDQGKASVKSKRLYGLDFLKAVATLIIVFHHYQLGHGVRFEHGLNFYYGKFYFGYVVELFFIISGFVMYKYIARFEQGLSFRKFMTDRYLRFQPLVFVSVTGTLVVSLIFKALYGFYWGNVKMSLVKYLLSAPCLYALWNRTLINNPLWYIGVLLVCYAVFYLTVRLAKKFSFSCVLGFVLITLIGVHLYSVRPDMMILNVRTARGLYAFFWGLLIAWYLQKRKPCKAAYVLAVAVLIGFPFVIWFANDFISNGINFYMTFLYYTALVLVFSSDAVNKLFAWDFWGTCSDISFNVYVWHGAVFVFDAILFYIVGWMPHFARIRTMVCMTVGVYIFGIISYYYIDKPCRLLIRKLTVK